MKMFCAGLVMAAVLAVPASAQAPTVQSLQRQVASLQRQVAALSKTDRFLNRQVTLLFNETATLQTNQQQDEGRLQTDETTYNGYPNYFTCEWALASDRADTDWHVINLVAQAALHVTPEPDLPRVDDKGTCAAIGVTRSP